MTITKDEFFKPGRMSSQDKALATDNAAKRIVATEAALRAKKTERLRLLREAQKTEAVAQSLDDETTAPKSVRT